MKFTRKMLATSMIAAAGAIPLALGLSATAAADPAPTPGVPGLPFLQQLATNPATATTLMQGLTSFLGTAQTAAAPAAAPAAGPSTATASLTLPQAPAAAPAAAAPLAAPQNLLTSVPGALASLMPAGTPFAGLLPSAPTAPAAAAPAAAAAPVAAAPAAPASQAIAPLLMPLSALP